MPAQYRAQQAAFERREQIRTDAEIARQLQDQEEGLPVAASMRSANERQLPAPQARFVPPVVPSDSNSDEEEQEDNENTAHSPVIPASPVVDRNGAYTPEPYENHLQPRQPAPVAPPVVPPVLDRNGAYTPEPYQRHNPPRRPAPAIPPVVPPVLDRNGAYTPEPYQRHNLPRRPAPAIPPVVPPVPDRNGAYTPEPYQRHNPPRGFAPVIPPVIPSGHNQSGDRAAGTHRPSQPPQSAPVIPPAPPTLPMRGRYAFGPCQLPHPPQPVPVIPPVVPDPYPAPHAGFGRAATPAPPRPLYQPWYPPGVVPHHLCPQPTAPTVRPVCYYPQQQAPPRVVVPAPAPPIPPIFRERQPFANSSPPEQKEEPIVPFIPPMPDEKPSPKSAPRPILKPKPPSAVKYTKSAVSCGTDDVQASVDTESNTSTSVSRAPRNSSRTRAVPAQSPHEAKEAIKSSEGSESSESNILAEEDEITDNDVDLESGPLHDLRKHIHLLTGPFKCNSCFAKIRPKPIHKHLGTLSPSLPSFDSHLHLMCSECHTLHCRGCHVTSGCRRTCNAGPDEKCLLKTCCRAGRAIAIFTILSCFDAKFLAMVSASPYSTYIEYIKNALSPSSASSLSNLLCTTIKSLLPWLPVEPIHSKSMPHVHRSVEPLFRVSLLLEVIRIYLCAPRERWIRRKNGEVYEQILMFLRRLEKVGKGAIAGLVLKPGRGIRRTRGVGEVVWALAKCVSEKNKDDRARKNLSWTAGNEHESFSEILGKKKLRRDLQDLKDKIQQDHKEKKELLDQFLCELLSWSMADALKT